MATKAHIISSGEIEKLQNPERWILKPRQLNIIWGNDNRYWKMHEKEKNKKWGKEGEHELHMSINEWRDMEGDTILETSDFILNREGPAELVQVCWLEVTGSTKEPLTKGKQYEVTFEVEMKDEAFGWNGCNVFIMAKIGKKGKSKSKKVNFSGLPKNIKTRVPSNDSEQGCVITVPENPAGNDTVLYFGLYEVWSGRWKGGLLIHEAQVKELN